MQNSTYIFDIETSGLEALFDKISCISLLNIETGKIESFTGNDEKVILTSFWAAISSAYTIYSYNGDSFDLPFIIKRSLINSVKIASNYRNMKFVDLRKVVNAFFVNYDKNQAGKLSDWAAILGKKVDTEPGKFMVERYYLNKFDEIKEHCEEDVQLTFELLKRAKLCGLI
jgi:uncharacterized protein